MKKEQIHIRDPFILSDEGKYYLYGSRGGECWGKCSGLDVYLSEDLESWSDSHECFSRPENFWSDMHFWAPEVHKYKNKYYMFVSFKSEDRHRGTQILVADTPMGPFISHSDGPVTPPDWECLDGTFYVDKNNTPYIVFCHEWTQVSDGEICAMKLSDDLKESIGNPIELFKASSFAKKSSVKGDGNYVTDGPFLYRLKDGQLIMIWSSFSNGKYCEIISYTYNGDIDGKWYHKKELLFEEDGGHGMLFHKSGDDLYFVMHSPNSSPNERPCIIPVHETNGTVRVK